MASKLQLNIVRSGLVFEHVDNILEGDVGIEFAQNFLKLLFVDQSVVEQVVHKMEQKLSLKFDLSIVFPNTFHLFGFVPHSEQETDNDDDRAEGSAHLMGHGLIAVPQTPNLSLAMIVLLFKNVIGNFFRDVTQVNCRNFLSEISH